MKKIIAIFMTAVMLFAMLVPVGATATSPVKSYEDAKKGELLYTVDFRGDSAFTPARTEADEGQMDYEIAPDGSWVRIKPITDAADRKVNLWGGLIKELPATENTIYSMVYRAKANGTAGKNNSVGVGGWAVGEDAFETKSGVYNDYANYTTVDANGSTADQRHALADGIYKIGEQLNESGNGYVKTDSLDPYAVDADGFQTVLLVFNGSNYKFSNYILAEGATDLKEESSWIKIDEREMMTALMDPDVENYMCFWTYAFYNVVDTTIKNVEFYKDYLWADPNDTTPVQTTAAATTAAATTAAATTAAATKPAATKPATTTAKVEEEKGCGGTVTVAGIALVATLGTCAVYVEKKKRK